MIALQQSCQEKADRQSPSTPERLELTDLDAPVVLAFLDHLERKRRNTIRSRNARLAAIRSFAHFAASKDPTALPSLQGVLAIPMKRFDKPLLGLLSSLRLERVSTGERDESKNLYLYNFLGYDVAHACLGSRIHRFREAGESPPGDGRDRGDQ